jgi:glycosyltransferase involved in cell wall biosynthesis
MRFLVAIPVYNEAGYLPRVLAAVRAQGFDVLVINDGSTDETPRLLRRYDDVAVIEHPENRGYGQSLIDAFDYAARQGYDWVITMDCDEQHEPAELPLFVEQARTDRWDVVSGSRYLRQFPQDDLPPEDRYRINHLVNGLVEQVLGLRLTDSFCGFKAHRVEAMLRLRLDEPGYAFPLQFWVQVARARLRVMEVPVRRIYRDKSRSFGGTLDDPAARLQHYMEVFVRALRSEEPLRAPVCQSCCCGETPRS